MPPQKINADGVGLTAAQDAERRKLAKELERRLKYRVMDFFQPYPKQVDFFAMTKAKRETLFMAGNQLGKTEAGAFKAACHMTGAYPDWWPGRRWDRPTRGWAAGETSLLARDVLQKKLCGEPGVDSAFGTGMIPKEFFAEKPSLARGITDAYDTIQVRHVSGGISVARFKSYEQGRTKFQGETLDWIWGDEEPPMDIYSEMLTRVTATQGLVYVTFTPLKGMSEVVGRFLNEPSDDRGIVNMTIEDAQHIPPEERARIIAGYPAHEREARARGVPMLGSGRIFPISEEAIAEEAFAAPSYWPKLWGIDFGIGHPFGAVLYAWDRDADCLHVLHAFRMKDARPIDHAKAMKGFGTDIPVAWPRDGTNREAGSGEPLSKLYKAEGLRMLSDHATWPDGGISTEAGVQEMYDRMTTGRFKVARHLKEWWEEFRIYHRKDGMIVKLSDDLMSASRVGVMMKRYSRVAGAQAYSAHSSQQSKIAAGVEAEHWGI
jgi:phage terminase large subunit-like protein